MTRRLSAVYGQDLSLTRQTYKGCSTTSCISRRASAIDLGDCFSRRPVKQLRFPAAILHPCMLLALTTSRAVTSANKLQCMRSWQCSWPVKCAPMILARPHTWLWTVGGTQKRIFGAGSRIFRHLDSRTYSGADGTHPQGGATNLSHGSRLSLRLTCEPMAHVRSTVSLDWLLKYIGGGHAAGSPWHHIGVSLKRCSFGLKLLCNEGKEYYQDDNNCTTYQLPGSRAP